jgi:hypothetical protein
MLNCFSHTIAIVQGVVVIVNANKSSFRGKYSTGGAEEGSFP